VDILKAVLLKFLGDVIKTLISYSCPSAKPRVPLPSEKSEDVM
jgi:hypothetical protein